jgi:hypothetical protein
VFIYPPPHRDLADGEGEKLVGAVRFELTTLSTPC